MHFYSTVQPSLGVISCPYFFQILSGKVWGVFILFPDSDLSQKGFSPMLSADSIRKKKIHTFSILCWEKSVFHTFSRFYWEKCFFPYFFRGDPYFSRLYRDGGWRWTFYMFSRLYWEKYVFSYFLQGLKVFEILRLLREVCVFILLPGVNKAKLNLQAFPQLSKLCVNPGQERGCLGRYTILLYTLWLWNLGTKAVTKKRLV